MTKEIPINPPLRDGFDYTPHEERSAEEIEQWWGVPYIVTVTWDDVRPDVSYEAFIERMGEICNWTPPSREQWEQEAKDREARWFEAWPTGTRYDVCCLDGGAWDRSTTWGQFATLDEAIVCAKKPVPYYMAGVLVYNPENHTKHPT
jgi:hypothetical protein